MHLDCSYTYFFRPRFQVHRKVETLALGKGRDTIHHKAIIGIRFSQYILYCYVLFHGRHVFIENNNHNNIILRYHGDHLMIKISIIKS